MKKLIIIGIVFEVQESFENLSVLLTTLKINSIDFTVAFDLKLANVIVEIQNHSSKHPCTWCEESYRHG